MRARTASPGSRRVPPGMPFRWPSSSAAIPRWNPPSPPAPTPRGSIYAANQGDLLGENASVEALPRGASGTAPPRARIAGASTGLTAPAGLALDAAGNIYVPNPNAFPADITIYVATADGDVAPTN